MHAHLLPCKFFCQRDEFLAGDEASRYNLTETFFVSVEAARLSTLVAVAASSYHLWLVVLPVQVQYLFELLLCARRLPRRLAVAALKVKGEASSNNGLHA